MKTDYSIRRNRQYSGRTKYSAFVSKLNKLSEEYLSPQKAQKAAVFLFERSWAGERFKILTKVNS
jgi:hypothetical protein